MKRVTIMALAAIFALTTTHLAFADDHGQPAVTASSLGDEAKCKRTSFKTALVKSACAKGLKAAIKAMKGFVKKAKAASGEKVTCKTCHSGLKKDGYPNKKDGLATYKRLKAAIDAAKITPHLSKADQRAVEAWVR